MKIRVSAPLAILAALLVVHAHAVPAPQEFSEQQEDGGSRTWTAMKDFFRPVKNWFVDDLPEKTPGDLYNDAKETAQDVGTWAKNDETVQGLVSALRPVHVWLKDQTAGNREHFEG
ncbi:uncharacterized protein LOC143027124 isoform X2 [Oratosquilla oratoria]|uniref:uncharacterized protein LOC143027124 isoform X2 n=1 Tax=Oratosquilla oratoria TaxID=337810 RepID=UPI003F761909